MTLDRSKCIAIVLRGDRGLEHTLSIAVEAYCYPLRSFFGAIEDWNRLIERVKVCTNIAIVLRGDRGLELEVGQTIGHCRRGLRSFFGAIEDWNMGKVMGVAMQQIAIVLRGDRGLELGKEACPAD